MKYPEDDEMIRYYARPSRYFKIYGFRIYRYRYTWFLDRTYDNGVHFHFEERDASGLIYNIPKGELLTRMFLPVKKTVKILGAAKLDDIPADSRPNLMALTELKFSDPILTSYSLTEELVLPNGKTLTVRHTRELVFSYELLMQTCTTTTINPRLPMDDLKMRIDRMYANFFGVNVSKLGCLDQVSLNTQVLLFFLAEKAQSDKTFLSRLFPYPNRQTCAIAELVDFRLIPQ